MKTKEINLFDEHSTYCICGHSAYDHELHYDSNNKEFYYGDCLEWKSVGVLGSVICGCKKFQQKK